MGYLSSKRPIDRYEESPSRTNFHWLPDSKNLSFVYKGTLYLLPVK